MESIQNILTRRSIRSFEDRRISEEDMRTILTAAMSGPSCANTRDWQFIVVEDKETLNQMADANGRPAAPLRQAAAGILICGDLNKAFPRAKEYWVIDGAIAGQNICLAARALGIGSVWLGTWPQMERVEKQAELFHLPESVVPHSVIALGYSEETEDAAEKGSYDESCVHWEKW
ncbi:MAG: nitroreductase family protein [Oscillospiraceae bacterium]